MSRPGAARVVGLDVRHRFLSRFGEATRSTIVVRVMAQIRERGAPSPEALVDGLIRRAHAEADLADARRDQAAADEWSLLYHGLRGHPDEARDLARAALAAAGPRP